MPRWNTLAQWKRALSMQYHVNTTDRKYQLLFVVNFVKLHLTAFTLNYLSLHNPRERCDEKAKERSRNLSDLRAVLVLLLLWLSKSDKINVGKDFLKPINRDPYWFFFLSHQPGKYAR